jgi:hypothetical protein
MLRSLARTLCLFAALTACAPRVVTPLVLPTLTPAAATATVLVPANTAIPPTASPAPSPTDQDDGQAVTASATREPLPTLDLAPTPPPTDIPQPAAGSSAIQIYSPGPLSKVVSGLRAYGYALPGYDDRGRIELFGEDGRLLAWQNLQLLTSVRWAYFIWDVPFQTNAAGELGRLTVSTRDQYGRLTALNSVRLLLLSQGYPLLYPPGNLQERCVIELPLRGTRITGGRLLVEGEIRPYNGLPLSVELIARDGAVVGSQVLVVAPSPEDSYLPFRAEITYTVAAPTDALLTVSQPDDRVPGLMYVYTQPAFINP